MDVGIELRGGSHAPWRRRHVFSICAPHATSVFQTPRPTSFHSNGIQSQPLFLLINTAVSLHLHRRTRIHLDGCISWGDPGGSRDVTDEERWWENSCWSDSLDFCNHTKTGRNHYSFIFILTNPTDRVLRKRAEIVVHRWFVGCISPVGLCSGQISFTCWRIAYWNWKLRCNDFYFWNDFVSAVNNDLLLAYACQSQVLLWGETLDDFYKVERAIYKLIKKKHSFLNDKINH